MKSSMALTQGVVGAPLGSAEGSLSELEATVLAGDAMEAGDTQDRWAQAGRQRLGAPAPQATKGQSR